MQPPDDVPIDDVTPSSAAMLVDMRDRLFLQHGGAAVRVLYKGAHITDLDTFLQHDVAKLKDRRDVLSVIRSDHTLSAIFRDSVVQYDVDTLNDVSLDLMLEEIKAASGDKMVFAPNILYPLVCYVKDSREKNITVLLQGKRIHFTMHSDHDALPDQPWEEDIYLPPIWFRVRASLANEMLDCYVAVVHDNADSPENATLCKLLLPNIHSSGEVCLGHSSMVGCASSSNDVTDHIMVQTAIDQSQAIRLAGRLAA